MAGSDSKNTTHLIPTPVGGAPDVHDQAASILFAALYFLLLVAAVVRVCQRTARTWLLCTTTAVVIERVIVYSFRALGAFDEKSRYEGGHLQYVQSSLAVGYFQLLQDVVPLLRCLLVRATNGPDIIDSIYDKPRNEVESRDEKSSVVTDSTLVDDAAARRRWRSLTGPWMYVFVTVCSVPNIVQGAYYDTAYESAKAAVAVQVVRQLAGAIMLTVLVILTAFVFMKRNQCAPKAAVWRLLAILGLLVIVSVYRTIVMRHTVHGTRDNGPGSLNSIADKSCFYLFHSLPEFLAAAILLVPNTRKAFGAGGCGDWRHYDGQQRKTGGKSWRCFRSRKCASDEQQRTDADLEKESTECGSSLVDMNRTSKSNNSLICDS